MNFEGLGALKKRPGWWRTPLALISGLPRQRVRIQPALHHKFEASQGYIASPCLKLRERESKGQSRSWAAAGRTAEADKGEGEPGGAGWGRARGERRSRAGGEKGKEAEVPGGHGARAGSGEGRRAGGRGLRKNAPTSCPPEPGSRSRDAEPGIAEPDLGRPAGHLPARTPGTPSLAPPGLLPSPPPGEEQGGDRAPGASRGAPSGPAVASPWPRFSHLSKTAKRKNPARWRAPVIPQVGKQRQENCPKCEVSDLA